MNTHKKNFKYLPVVLGVLLILIILYLGGIFGYIINPLDNSEFAIINNSGSTNAPGFTLTLYNDGSGSLIYTRQPVVNKTLPDKDYPKYSFDITKLKRDLLLGGGFEVTIDRIFPRVCPKSASFGTFTTITYQALTSGDLECPSPIAYNLSQDVGNITNQILKDYYAQAFISTPSQNHMIKPNFITTQISWNASTNTLPPEGAKQLIDTIKTLTLKQLNYKEDPTYYLDIEFISIDNTKTIDGEWITLDGVPVDGNTNLVIPTEPFEMYGHKTSTGWQIISSLDPNFCKIYIPVEVTDKSYFCPKT